MSLNKPFSLQHKERQKKEKETHDKNRTPKESVGQRFKKSQNERKELIQIIKYSLSMIEQFQKNPEEAEKINISLEMMILCASKLKLGVERYLKDYETLRGSDGFMNTFDSEERSIVRTLEMWTCTEGFHLKKEFDSLKTVFNENSFFNAVKDKVNINVVIKDGPGNIFGFHVSVAPSQKNLAVVDKTHFIFSIKNVAHPDQTNRQFVPSRLIESFVIFHKSNYVFCVPYAFAIVGSGKSAISPKISSLYFTKEQKKFCTPDDINGTVLPNTFPVEWVKVFVQ
ncbi:hypothetical protein EHI8A_097560 [Entamoeba histolytica HM-1:IMSS-B]|nr:hypothetical protein EHI8A_097560 [Entamoeba histolytica HM-1:IMSS-B]EMS15337.1 hypothetical protein KM1_166310 [Entamoeba histolytica HM-3:IMSS]BAN39028.1 hypothetical protein [Entamoeba histolytica]GAT98762.1 hypothetical protein CL6EHI_172160 [Entamoeba histolytica]